MYLKVWSLCLLSSVLLCSCSVKDQSKLLPFEAQANVQKSQPAVEKLVWTNILSKEGSGEIARSYGRDKSGVLREMRVVYDQRAIGADVSLHKKLTPKGKCQIAGKFDHLTFAAEAPSFTTPFKEVKVKEQDKLSFSYVRNNDQSGLLTIYGESGATIATCEKKSNGPISYKKGQSREELLKEPADTWTFFSEDGQTELVKINLRRRRMAVFTTVVVLGESSESIQKYRDLKNSKTILAVSYQCDKIVSILNSTNTVDR